MSQYLHIRTPYGNAYVVDMASGYITHETARPKFSHGWKLLGLVHVRRTRYASPDISLADIVTNPNLLSKIPTLYKNGHPQFTVVDWDHGSRRIWGNVNVHGISRIWVNDRMVG